MECLFHIQHLLIQAWHVVVEPCRRDPALGELPALRKMRPVSSSAGFLPPSFSEAYEMVLLLLFPQRPLKLLLLLFFKSTLLPRPLKFWLVLCFVRLALGSDIFFLLFLVSFPFS